MRVRQLVDDPSFREGFRTGIPVAIAGIAVGASFGVLARPEIGVVAPIVMSATVFAGAAQFGAVAVLAAGGSAAAAIAAGVLLNARYLAMGAALAPSVQGPALRRTLISQAMVDFSWAAAMRGGGRFDVRFMIGATVPMYFGWVSGTALGVLLGEWIGDTGKLGFDAMFPAFFVGLLLSGEVRSSPRAVPAAVFGGLIALALIPLTPPGIPIIAACLAALIGLDRKRRPAERAA